MWSTSNITWRPNGLTSARCGTFDPIRLKSSSDSSTSASCAIASRCSTALVEPPNAITTAIAFSNASLVRMSRAVMPRRSSSTTAWPLRRANPSRRRSVAGGAALPGSDMPSASAALAMVLAVYMPPHAPSPGQIARSMASTSSRGINPRAHAPDGLERVDDGDLALAAVGELGHPRQDRAGVEEHRGQVQAGGGHQHAGQRFVAAGQQHRAVQPFGLHHGLDAVGDHLARHQREVHALVAHRDAVGNRDRAELERVAAGREHALLDRLGQPVQREVARRDLVPRRCDADLRLGEVLVSHADRAQHATGGGLLQTVGDVATAGFDVRGPSCKYARRGQGNICGSYPDGVWSTMNG